MQLALVIGSIQATVKHEILENEKLMMVVPIDDNGKKSGAMMIALDKVQSGAGDTVLVVDEGNSARTILENSEAPMRSVILAIVDNVDTGS